MGVVRPTIDAKREFKRGLMHHDGDADLCLLSESLPEERIEDYYNYCVAAGLMKEWYEPLDRIERRSDTGDLLWFSIKKGEAKCCNWIFFKWKGYYWHCKGKYWVNPRKFPNHSIPANAEAVMKGAPEDYFNELIEVDLEGIKVKMPKKAGHLLDFWYPQWHEPAIGASKRKVVAVVNKWAQKDSWKIL